MIFYIDNAIPINVPNITEARKYFSIYSRTNRQKVRTIEDIVKTVSAFEHLKKYYLDRHKFLTHLENYKGNGLYRVRPFFLTTKKKIMKK